MNWLKNKLLARFVAFFAFALGLCASAQAAVPTEVSDLVTDAGSVWGTVKTFIIGVLAFTLLVGVARKLRKS